MLDLGTGTGVLAIAAAKALRCPVLASDIDPDAVQVARENARLNVSRHLVRAIRATGLAAPVFAAAAPFDLILANIPPLRRGNRRHRCAAFGAGRAGHPVGAVDAGGARRIAAYRTRGLVPLRHLRIDCWSSLLLQKVS